MADSTRPIVVCVGGSIAAYKACDLVSTLIQAGHVVEVVMTEAAERALLKLTLRRTGGDQKAAAELLGVARNTLRAKAIRFGLIQPRPRRAEP